jgi:hypothetical protein
MRPLALVLLSFAAASPAQASSQTIQAHRTLEAAVRLAGPSAAGLPITLAEVPPDEASRGIEGWMLPGQGGGAGHVVVYTGSDIFRCASHPDERDSHCLLKLASIVVHEAWHCRNGSSEAGAYDAQIEFLTTHGASGYLLSGVKVARDHVLAAQRAIERRR